MARSQSGSGASGVTGAALAGRGGGGKDLHCQHSGSQLFAAINVCLRNSCGRASPSCAGRAGEVCAGGRALKESSLGACCFCGETTRDAPMVVSTGNCVVSVLLCWEGTHCAWTFSAFLPSLPAGEDVNVYPAVCGVDCCPSWLPVRHCEPDWGRGDCAPGQGRLQLLLCAAPSSQLRTWLQPGCKSPLSAQSSKHPMEINPNSCCCVSQPC